MQQLQVAHTVEAAMATVAATLLLLLL